MEKELLSLYRFFLKDNIRKFIDFSRTDQNRGVLPPPLEKPYSDAAQRIELVKPGAWQETGKIDLTTAIGQRRSRRLFTRKLLSLEELSFLLWAVQGLREQPVSYNAFRTVPSAGCRHALETYLAVFNVQDLVPGLYRYLPISHQLLLEHSPPDLAGKTIKAAFGQSFVGQSAVTFIWTALPYRMEWRYDLAAHKVIAIDAGHVCQNLYLACEAIKAGTCAIAAYDQEEADALLGVDGEEEFVIYMAPVGKI